MIKENIFRRILYTGAGFVITVALLLTFIVIPCIILDKSPDTTPGRAVFGTLLTIILHLLVLYGFREAIIVNKRNGHLKNIVFVASGTGLLLLGLLIMDGAFAFMGQVHIHLTSVIMFICVGCDFLASVIAFTAILLQPKKTDIK
jgi:hypothetical protein